MMELLLPLLLGHSVPAMYQDELERDANTIVVSLVSRPSLTLESVSGMTGELPLPLYLLSLPQWPSLEDGWIQEGVAEVRPSWIALQKRYFTRLLSEDTVAAWHEAYREPDALVCRAGDYALWHSPFQRWLPEMPRQVGLECLQTLALATFFVSAPAGPDEDDRELVDNSESASSVFSVLNLTIVSNSAPVPEWRPINELRVFPDVSGMANETFIYPMTHAVFVTSPYGMRYHPISRQFIRHEGVDLRAAVNSPVLSIADGQVVDTGYGPVTGFYVTINHADGWSSRYLHLSAVNVRKGESVLKGNIIARSGNTGRSNGPHLHLEIGQHQRLLDPMSVLFTTLASPNQKRAGNPAPSVSGVISPEPIDMTPAIVLVAGEGNEVQIGVRIGKRTIFYAPNEPVETEEGTWRIIKRYGKYKLVKGEIAGKSQ